MQLKPRDLPRRLPEDLARALVVGNELLMVEESAAKVRAHFKAQGFDEREVLHVDARFDWGQLYAQGGAMSLFGGKRLIEVRLPEAKAGTDGGKALVEFMEAQAPDTALLVIAACTAAMPKDTAWMKRLGDDAAGCVVRCAALGRDQLPDWLTARARTAGVTLSAEALQWLATQVEGNLLGAAQEIERLPLLGLEQPISAESLQDVVANHARFAGYELPDAILSGDLNVALFRIERLRGEGAAPPMLMATLARDLRQLHLAACLTRELGLDRALDQAGVWRKRKPLFAGALKRIGGGGARAVHRKVVALEKLSKGAPPERFWEELVNLAIRISTPARALDA